MITQITTTTARAMMIQIAVMFSPVRRRPLTHRWKGAGKRLVAQGDPNDTVTPGLDPGVSGRVWLLLPGPRSVGSAFVSGQRFVQVLPFWIGGFNQLDLPSARPALDVLLSLDRANDLIMPFEVDEELQVVALGETRNDTFAVLPSTRGQFARDTGVENAVWLVRCDVDPATFHGCRAWRCEGIGSRPRTNSSCP